MRQYNLTNELGHVLQTAEMTTVVVDNQNAYYERQGAPYRWELVEGESEMERARR